MKTGSFWSYFGGLLVSTACIYVWGTWRKWPAEKINYHLAPWILAYSAYMVLFIGNFDWRARAEYSTYIILPGTTILACILAIKLKWDWVSKMVSIYAMTMVPWIVYVSIGIMSLPIWFSLLLALLIGLFAQRYTKKYMKALVDIRRKKFGDPIYSESHQPK